MSKKTMRNVLVMEFLDVDGKVRSIRVSDPKADLEATAVQDTMELINDLNVFRSISAKGPATIKGAKTVQTVTSNFDIVIN